MPDNSNILDFNDPTFCEHIGTFQKLNQYRKKNQLTDVELQIGDKLFPAHRAVLSAGSPVLEAAFSENWTQSKIYPIGDEYVDVEIMKKLLTFFYTGRCRLTPDNAHSICVAAHFLQISTLIDASANHLSKLITLENVLTLFAFSHSHSLNVLLSSCLEFIFTNYPNVFQDPQTLQLPSKNFTDLIVELKTHCFGTRIRESTFDCVIRWAEKNHLELEFPVLLENIPLDEVSYRFLVRTVFTHPLVKESFPCIQNILEALKLSSFEAVRDSELDPSSQDLIVIGGRKSSDRYSSVMNYYHADSQTWRRLPDMLQMRAAFAVTINNQRDIIVSGGSVWDNDQSLRTGSVEMFCWESHTWQNLSDMPRLLSEHSMAVHKGHLYVASQKFWSGNLKVRRYSFEEREWSSIKSIKCQEFCSRMVSYKDHLYVIGGCSNFVERYDPAKNEWTTMTRMNRAANSVRATVHQEKIYTSGGDVFEVYDPETDVWTSLPAITIDGADPTDLISLNGKLLAICDNRVSRKRDESSIYEFDLSNQQWRKFADFPPNIFPHHALVGGY